MTSTPPPPDGTWADPRNPTTNEIFRLHTGAALEPIRHRSRRGSWLFATKRRRITTVSIGSVVVAALVAGGVFGVGVLSAEAQQQSAVDTANTAVHRLATVEITNQAAKVALDEAIAATQQYSIDLSTVVAAAPAYLDVTAAAALEQARAGLDAAIVTVKTPASEESGAVAASTTFETPPVTRILPKNPTTAEASKIAKKLDAATVAVGLDTDAKRAALDTLNSPRAAVLQALRAVANTAVVTNAPAVRAAAPNVDVAALEQAVTALQVTSDDSGTGVVTDEQAALASGAAVPAELISAVNGYVAAAKTVLDAQTAFNTQAAIDAANAAGNDTYVDPDTGESKPNPNYDNSDSDSGSGSGGGGSGGGSGGSGGGSDPGSGGGGTPAPNPPRVVYGSSSCSGAGGYAEVSYSNRGIVVPGSGVASYNGPYDSGTGWRVDWTCV